MGKLFLGLLAAGTCPFCGHAENDHSISQRTMAALTHVVAHEIGHAFIREFDIPIIGPEEAIADDFATVYVYLMFPNRAEYIIAARADQNLMDGEDAGMFSEYMDDDQRAGRSVCLLYGLDPEHYAGLRDTYGMDNHEAATCRDLGPEVGRSWRRLIDRYRMPESAKVTEVRLTGDDIPLTHYITSSQLGDDAKAMMRAIDWHSEVTLSIEVCEDGTGWKRNGRRITICDSYVERFERQFGG